MSLYWEIIGRDPAQTGQIIYGGAKGIYIVAFISRCSRLHHLGNYILE